MNVFLDLDGVVTDFVGGAIAYYGLSVDLGSCRGNYDSFPGPDCMGMGKECFWSGLGYSFWANLKMLPHAERLLEVLRPHQPVILTSPGHYAAGGKQRWIKDNLPDYFYDGRYLIGPKKEIIAGPGQVLIDDRPKHIERWKARGGFGILYPHWFNPLWWIRDPIPYVKTQLHQAVLEASMNRYHTRLF